MIDYKPSKQYGWECPNCGSVYSPYTTKCSECPKTTTVSVGTSGTATILSHNFLTSTYDSELCAICGFGKIYHSIITNT